MKWLVFLPGFWLDQAMLVRVKLHRFKLLSFKAKTACGRLHLMKNYGIVKWNLHQQHFFTHLLNKICVHGINLSPKLKLQILMVSRNGKIEILSHALRD